MATVADLEIPDAAYAAAVDRIDELDPEGLTK